MISTPTTIGGWAIWLIITCGVIGIAYLVILQTGIVIPAFIVSILWIVLAVVVGILFIRFLMSISSTP